MRLGFSFSRVAIRRQYCVDTVTSRIARVRKPLPPQPQSPIQRRYYWSILRAAARYWYPDDRGVATQKWLHNEFKGNLLGFEEVLNAGAVVLEPISTTSLDHAEFSEFIESVLSILVESGMDLPDRPEELLEICPRDLPEPLPLPRKKGAQ